MLSRNRYVQLAAVAALSVLFGANASMTTASAQAGIKLAQTDQKEMQRGERGDVRKNRGGEARENQRGDVRGSSNNERVKVQSGQNDTQKSSRRDNSNREFSSDRSNSRFSIRSDNRRETFGANTVVRHRDRDRRRIVVRDRGRSSVAFVILGPRRHYRPGWCRGLHRGFHWAPGIGRHAGRHFGLFRC
jgi:hypothetical protein